MLTLAGARLLTRLGGTGATTSTTARMPRSPVGPGQIRDETVQRRLSAIADATNVIAKPVAAPTRSGPATSAIIVIQRPW